MKEKIVRAMTALCKDLGMLVVAEGIETGSERDLLVDAGCDLLQGYLLGRPAKLVPMTPALGAQTPARAQQNVNR